MADMKETSKILVILGGIVGLLEGILSFTGTWVGPWGGIFTDPGMAIIRIVVVVIFSLIALATSGAVEIKALKLQFNMVVLLVVGIVLLFFGASFGGILVVLGGILLLLK